MPGYGRGAGRCQAGRAEGQAPRCRTTETAAAKGAARHSRPDFQLIGTVYRPCSCQLIHHFRQDAARLLAQVIVHIPGRFQSQRFAGDLHRVLNRD